MPMIRGPILPQLRESLWTLVSTRLDMVERGLELVLEGLDCSGGQLGLVEGLARDASGAPVLVLLAVDGDALLTARVLAAADFLQRLGDALVTAVPEARLCLGAVGRVLVVGTEAASASLDSLGRLPVPGLQVCRLEPFRIAGGERFAVRWLPAPAASGGAAAPSFVVPDEQRDLWRSVQELCSRIDPGVRIDGDRYWRRVSWQGRALADVRLVDGTLRAEVPGASPCDLLLASDVRSFGDRLLRRFVELAGLKLEQSPAVDASVSTREAAPRLAASGRRAGNRSDTESLRSVAAAARLSPEEYSALGGPASAAGGDAEIAVPADGDEDVIAAAPDSPWPPTRRPG
jgi:hypothetical protein